MESLTDIELEFVKLVCQGLLHEEIAKRLFRSIHTISGYRESVRRKTNSETMAQAIATLYGYGILKPSSSYEHIRTRSRLPTSYGGEDSGPVEKLIP